MPLLTLLASYASQGQSALGKQLGLGEGLVGQCAVEKQKILLTNVPPDYIRISSGLGDAPPKNILVLPVVFEGQVKGVLELASFERFNPTHQAFLDQLTESIGIVLNTIEANMRTEDLLKQSQSLAQELQSRQEELQQTNQELQEKARLLAHQNEEVERKNREVEQARQALEEKAKQLALTSKYKSEFLANMSHELRTPLNSLLILSDQLSKNPDGNLTPKQTEFAKTIHSSGNDLLMLINDILDLSKIESGTVVVDVGELRLADLHDYVERTFRHVAESKSVDFFIKRSTDLPPSMFTDAKRLQQVLKNLLSNAFKFTHHGQVTLIVEAVQAGWSRENESLNRAPAVLAFTVTDTGIGIPPDKQQIIFEAFQQADGSTSRKYGGTGLGLAISRELSRLLGGEIRLRSTPGEGSTFTLYLPQTYMPPRARARPRSRSKPLPRARRRRCPTAPGRPRSLLPYRPFWTRSPRRRRSSSSTNGATTAKASSRATASCSSSRTIRASRGSCSTPPGTTASRDWSPRSGPALALEQEYPVTALTLDIFLPDMEGWRVLERLKNDLHTRHIPVCVISTDEARERALNSGALAFVPKPVKTREVLDQLLREVKDFNSLPASRLVVVEPDAARRAAHPDGHSAGGLPGDRRGRRPDRPGGTSRRARGLSGSGAGRPRREAPGRGERRPWPGRADRAAADRLRDGRRRGRGRLEAPVPHDDRPPRSFPGAFARRGGLFLAWKRRHASGAGAPRAGGPASLRPRPAGQAGADRR